MNGSGPNFSFTRGYWASFVLENMGNCPIQYQLLLHENSAFVPVNDTSIAYIKESVKISFSTIRLGVFNFKLTAVSTTPYFKGQATDSSMKFTVDCVHKFTTTGPNPTTVNLKPLQGTGPDFMISAFDLLDFIKDSGTCPTYIYKLKKVEAQNELDFPANVASINQRNLLVSTKEIVSLSVKVYAESEYGSTNKLF